MQTDSPNFSGKLVDTCASHYNVHTKKIPVLLHSVTIDSYEKIICCQTIQLYKSKKLDGIRSQLVLTDSICLMEYENHSEQFF